MKFLKALPIIFLIFLISCSTQVSDSISQTNYKEVEGINFDEKDKIDTSLEDKVFFDFRILLHWLHWKFSCACSFLWMFEVCLSSVLNPHKSHRKVNLWMLFSCLSKLDFFRKSSPHTSHKYTMMLLAAQLIEDCDVFTIFSALSIDDR